MVYVSVINNNASNSKSVLNYEKQMLLKSIDALKKLDIEISELEVANGTR